jgi:outer membrane receptor protein involved in Fe transport
MKTNKYSIALSSLSLAIITALSSSVHAAQENNEIEEVVVKASRLKGTASAVIEERKNQAFVADILGAEQIGRTGDSDAAAALRRVTGITLVDGKFIYVRGLGERYSSTLLNGAAVPSPDPSRSIIPLDLFPSAIIESLSVQKGYSPSMPAHFGGGNVDIRLKTIPSDFTFTMAGNLGGNTDNFGEGFTYNGGGRDWRGRDDGTRKAPNSLTTLWNNYNSLNDLSQADNRIIAAELNRDYDPIVESLDPDGGIDITIGDKFESGDFKYGYLTSFSYDNEWQYSEGYEGQDFKADNSGFVLARGFDNVKSTEHSVKLSAMLNFGLEYDRNHRFDFSNVILRDTVDEIKDKFGNSENVSLSENLRIRDTEVRYEERELISHQIKGTHNLPDYWNMGVDWKYSNARSNRYAPGNISTRYILSDENLDGIYDVINESSLRKASTASRYTFQDLDDEVENYGFNVSLPLTFKHIDVELKVGGDFIEKNRDASARRIDVETRGFDNADLLGHQLNNILTEDTILNYTLGSTDNIIRDTSIDGDDYFSAQLIDAYYVEGDVFIDNMWRISGGVRWEDYRHVVAPLKPSTGAFDLPDIPTPEDLLELSRQEDELYPAIALTYIPDDTMQYRFSYAETVIRPDIREVAPTTYLDPLTDFPVRGTPGVRSTSIKNYDLRWEWYVETGETLSVGLFYKDMLNPIESVQSPAQDGPPLIVIANADEGEVYGVEIDFMKDFTFLGGIGNDFFLSGNVTLSDSEIKIDPTRVEEQTGLSTAITNKIRRMTGHSEYVVNLNLGYDAPNGNHSATLAYNVFGDRIIIPGIDGQDDRFEQPFQSLDLIYTYFPSFSTSLKFKIQNILDEKKEIEFSDTLFRSETKGIAFDIAFKWDFE